MSPGALGRESARTCGRGFGERVGADGAERVPGSEESGVCREGDAVVGATEGRARRPHDGHCNGVGHHRAAGARWPGAGFDRGGRGESGAEEARRRSAHARKVWPSGVFRTETATVGFSRKKERVQNTVVLFCKNKLLSVIKGYSLINANIFDCMSSTLFTLESLSRRHCKTFFQ